MGDSAEGGGVVTKGRSVEMAQPWLPSYGDRRRRQWAGGNKARNKRVERHSRRVSNFTSRSVGSSRMKKEAK